MKIDGKTYSLDVDATYSDPRVSGDRRSNTVTADRARSGTDRVDVSDDARLLHAALASASQAPAIRQDRVDAVRQKLEAGQIGNDSERLADRLIDELSGQ